MTSDLSSALEVCINDEVLYKSMYTLLTLPVTKLKMTLCSCGPHLDKVRQIRVSGHRKVNLNYKG